MLVPNHKLEECLEFCLVETYPLWLCPHRLFKTGKGTMLYCEPNHGNNKYPGDTDYAQMWTDVGIWGVPGPVLRQEVWDGVEATKNMEKWLMDNRGYQCLYAEVEQSEEDFWKMFDATLYIAVRKKYGAEYAFMSVIIRFPTARNPRHF
ncbi:hypothetical protein O6H91_Y323100 [Diphasiastrum complanatum]|nr:hypothetical protein O6H91_Y323100 [Diphasiastrum complanatum]KAJ7286665.1 hypothetical protein O6H91_Y323100 [Diphasiastrum complanatum]KAJ7286666.1 hypothetical protein O6H91_Y323100 [Diphasiastrum complanatum]